MNSKRLWMNGRRSFVAMVRGYVLPSMQISRVCLLYWKTVKMTCDKCEKQVSKHASAATWGIQTRTYRLAWCWVLGDFQSSVRGFGLALSDTCFCMFLLTCGLAYSLFLDIPGYFWTGEISVGLNLLKTAQGELTDLIWFVCLEDSWSKGGKNTRAQHMWGRRVPGA